MTRSRRAQSASNVARLHRRCIHFSTLPQVVHSAATNAPAEREPCWQSLTPRWGGPSASLSSDPNPQGGTDASRYATSIPGAPRPGSGVSDHPQPDTFVFDELLRQLIHGVFAPRNI